MWVLLDNYDSFTYILHHYLLQLHSNVVVIRNDEIDIQGLEALKPKAIIISPGPQTPELAGITADVVARFYQEIPILGICLGHQAIGQFLGARLTKALKPVHGSTSEIMHIEDDIFRNIPQGFLAMRYHSLVLEDWQQDGLVPLAFSKDGELMAFKHERYAFTGIQFHPESILTQYGLQLLDNWATLQGLI